MPSSQPPARPRRRLFVGSSVLAGAVVASCIACTVVPTATWLPRRATAASPEAPALDGAPGLAQAAAVEAAVERPSLEFQALELEGVRGGRLTFELAGSPEQVLEMLLDFEHAEGHRSWAQRFEVLERGDGEVVARWHFRGRFGIHPKPELRFRVGPGGRLVEFELSKTALGLAAFFGDYELRPVPGTRDRTWLTERVFIDSGIKLSNASHEDIAKGLADDAARMQAWMLERMAATGGPVEAR
jgi:hypothetical protein